MSLIHKITAEIARHSLHEWNFIVNNSILCRHLDGDYLRGILVDRTSTPGAYTLYALTCPWFTLSSIHLSYSLRLKRGDSFSGGGEAMAREMEPFLQSDHGVRKVVFAQADDPPFMDARLSYAGKEHEPVSLKVEYAAILAASGFVADARYRLHLLRYELREDVFGDHRQRERDLVIALQDCLIDQRDVRTVLGPLTAANKALAKVKALKQPA